MRQRREITASSDRSLFRNHRMNSAIEHLAKQLDYFETNAAPAKSEHIRAQKHHRAHFGLRKERTNAAGVTANEVELKLSQLVMWNADVGELAKSGVHPVHDNVAGDNSIDDLARSQNTRAHRSR